MFGSNLHNHSGVIEKKIVILMSHCLKQCLESENHKLI